MVQTRSCKTYIMSISQVIVPARQVVGLAIQQFDIEPGRADQLGG